ncbi:hypothetical protein LEMLEM_LOCUS23710 [Lemmus lemmus]
MPMQHVIAMSHISCMSCWLESYLRTDTGSCFTYMPPAPVPGREKVVSARNGWMHCEKERKRMPRWGKFIVKPVFISPLTPSCPEVPEGEGNTTPQRVTASVVEGPACHQTFIDAPGSFSVPGIEELPVVKGHSGAQAHEIAGEGCRICPAPPPEQQLV